MPQKIKFLSSTCLIQPSYQTRATIQKSVFPSKNVQCNIFPWLREKILLWQNCNYSEKLLAKINDFDKQTACGAPVRWLKSTTVVSGKVLRQQKGIPVCARDQQKKELQRANAQNLGMRWKIWNIWMSST